MIRLPPKMHRAVVACQESDARFFRRRPDRRYRVRLAGRGEIALARAEGSISAAIPETIRAFVAVARQPDEALTWVIGFASEGADTDLDEPTARAAFERFQQHDDATLRDLAAQGRQREGPLSHKSI